MEFEEFIKTLDMEKMAKNVCLSKNQIEKASIVGMAELISYMNAKFCIELLRQYDIWNNTHK